MTSASNLSWLYEIQSSVLKLKRPLSLAVPDVVSDVYRNSHGTTSENDGNTQICSEPDAPLNKPNASLDEPEASLNEIPLVTLVTCDVLREPVTPDTPSEIQPDIQPESTTLALTCVARELLSDPIAPDLIPYFWSPYFVECPSSLGEVIRDSSILLPYNDDLEWCIENAGGIYEDIESDNNPDAVRQYIWNYTWKTKSHISVLHVLYYVVCLYWEARQGFRRWSS
jgi:hypothetical protein